MPATARVSAPLDSVKQHNDDEALSSIISGIYDAALDAGRWCDVLTDIAEFTGGQAGVLLSKIPDNEVLKSIIASASIPDICRATRNAIPGPVRSRACRSSSRSHRQHSGAGALQRIPSRSVLPGVGAAAGLARRRQHHCRKIGRCCSILSVVRDDASGLVDGEMRRRMMLVAPHIRRAALVRHAMDCQRAEIATFAATLDGLRAGLFLIDADGRIVHANAAGRDILQGDDFLRSVGGRLTARDPQVHQALRDVFAAAGCDVSAIGLRGTALPLVAQDGGRYVAHVLPLSAETRQAAAWAKGPPSRCSSARSRWKARAPPTSSARRSS